MRTFLYIKHLVFLAVISSSSANAGVYLALAPSQIKIDTPSASTRPLLADFRLGYATPKHQFELAVMSSIDEDQLNQLTVDVPTARSAFYRYSPYPKSSLKVHLILGASQVDVESSYPGVADTTDRFEGASFGIGFEESLKSIPQLKIKFDWIRLYHGDQLNINTTSLGIRYEF